MATPEEQAAAEENATATGEEAAAEEKIAAPEEETATEEKKAKKKVKTTVRKRRRAPKASTQRFLPIGEIRNDTLILKNGGLRAILEIQALNFNLKSETEQMGIISGYESFVNTLNFPLQISIRSTKINIDPYITSLRAMGNAQENELLREQTLAYATFVERIVDIAEIMQKKFYVIVPLDDTVKKKSMFSQIFAWFGTDDTVAKATQRYRRFAPKAAKLRDRLNLVETGLRNIGLMTKRLTTHELIELFYQIYNPKTSQEQRLPPLSELGTKELIR